MANLPNTFLATSDPLDICSPNAFPYFGQGNAVDFGVEHAGTIFDVHPSLILFNLDFSFGYGLYIGVCGPAIALKFNLEGNYDAGQINAQVSGDEVQGGFVFGITLQLDFNFTVRKASLRWVKDGWKSHIERSWTVAFTSQALVQFDLISLILGLIVKILEEDGKKDTLLQKVNNINSNLLGSYGIFDDVTEGFANTGSFDINPAFTLPINLVPFIPPLKLFNEGLEKLMGGLFIGPTIGIAIPATVSMSEILVGGTTYSNLQVSGSQVTGTSAGTAPSNGNVQVNLNESPSLDFNLGFGGSISVLKVFSFSATVAVDVLSLLGLEPKLGTFHYSLENQVGSQSIQMAQVFFEEPVV